MGHISTILVLYVNYAGFNACYDILFCLFLSTSGMQNMCIQGCLQSQVGLGLNSPLELDIYENFITSAKEINCFRILFAC